MSLLYVERDTGVETVQTLCEDDASLMQAWSEDGADLVRRRCGEGVSSPEIGLQKCKQKTGRYIQ